MHTPSAAGSRSPHRRTPTASKTDRGGPASQSRVSIASVAPPYLAKAALPDGPQDLEVVKVHCRKNIRTPGEVDAR